MESLGEQILIYGITLLFLILAIVVYVRKLQKGSGIVDEKIKIAKEEGLFEPVSLHPFVDPDSCIGSGACILACPEKDILGFRNGRATVINASRCVGHGACFHACPTQAISLLIGTEQRGVDLPHVDQFFETNVKGIYIAGEIAGMGLIKNAVEQGRQAVDNIAKSLDPALKAEFDLVIIGAGPAGISATLQAKKRNLRSVTLEQDSIGGTVYTYPRSKIVMTSPMDIPLHGKVKLFETGKEELIDLWAKILKKNEIKILEHTRVRNISRENGVFIVNTTDNRQFAAQKVLLAIGRRGSPRKLNIPGEDLPKVFYRLLEPESVSNMKVLVVGGGDSAIEAALLLAAENTVTLSYRQATFSRLKPGNNSLLKEAIRDNRIHAEMNSNLLSIEEKKVVLRLADNNDQILENDLVYIFAGGELPAGFLSSTGITITRKFGERILTHDKK
jgi:thioredoxin reductase (NADPH)